MTKFLRSPLFLPSGTLLAGLLGALLRLWLQSANTESGHFSNSHIANWLLFGLVIAVFVLLVIGTWNLTEASKYSFNYPPSLLRCIGCVAGALALLVFNFSKLLTGGDLLSMITAVLGVLSAAVLGFIAFCRAQGKHPNFLLHCLIIVHFLLQLICYYRVWSGEPQMQTYVFPLLSTVFLMLSVYHSAMFDGNFGNRQAHTLLHLMTVFLCCIACVSDFHPLIFLGYGFWMLTDLCNLIPMPRSYRKEHRV